MLYDLMSQGYLSQVLSFHYHHPVVAIDASSHHGNVTDARALRIYKHYASQLRKSNQYVIHCLYHPSLSIFALSF